MLFTPISRDDLLRLLPKGGAVAEIGVALGEFSTTILDISAPERLHLIDPWRYQDSEEIQADPNNVPDAENEARFQEVAEKFAKGIESGRVVVHRKFSGEAVRSFEDESLDWVYLDGSHVYEDVLADLDSYDAKVKKDGFILGHDYTNHVLAKNMNFGVVEAVDRFVERTGYEFLVLNNVEFPTYVLAKSVSSEAAQAFLANIAFNVKGTIEIHDFPRRGFKHKEVISKNRVVNLIPSF